MGSNPAPPWRVAEWYRHWFGKNALTDFLGLVYSLLKGVAVSKFNETKKPASPTEENFSGGEAFSESNQLQIASTLLTSFVVDSFYEKSENSIKRFRSLISKESDKKFVAKAAILARDWGMRSITHVAVVELVKHVNGTNWLRPAIAKIIQRPDDATEILSLYMAQNPGSPIPNALKRGIGDALQKFNEYQIGKYKVEGHEVKLVDAVNLTHPRPTQALTALVKGTLEPPETWEVMLSKAGSDKNAKKLVWTRLLSGGHLPYFALLRNLRNIEQQAPDMIEVAASQLVNPEAIRNSKVLPFRYMTAIEQVSNPKLRAAISHAADISLSNVPKLSGTTLIALDVSGSMRGINYQDKKSPSEIGSLFAAALFKGNGADVMTFGDTVGWPKLNMRDSVTTIASQLPNREQGTNFNLIFDHANEWYDRIIILSDTQAWMKESNSWAGFGSLYRSSVPTESFKNYKSRTGADPKIWSFDLQHYGTLQFPERNVFAIAGFSEKVFDLIPICEEGQDALINRIKQVSLV